MDFARAYDYNGNPLYTEYGHKTTRSELYGTQAGEGPEGPADALNRLTRYRRGTLNGNKDDLTAVLFEQDWHDTAGALTLDKLGNWDAMRLDPDGDDTAQSMTATARGHNLANEYVSKDGQAAYGHDRNGNMTDDTKHTYYYDFANHLVVAILKDTGDTVGEYRYDALGRRVRKVVDDVSDTLDGTTLFFYDGMRVIEEGRLDGQGAYTATHQYVWGFYLDELLVFDYDAQGDFDLEDTSDQRGHSFQDFIYSTVAVMDPDGNVLERCDYEPYGAVTFWTPDYADTRAETQVHLDFLFTGQRLDPETGLYHYKFRTYEPPLGRFLQKDTIASWQNPYESVGSLPISLSDPLGLSPWSPMDSHPYPFHLGGSAAQPYIPNHAGVDHQALHAYFRNNGFGPGEAGRTLWARLTARQQQAHIIRGLRHAGLSNEAIRSNIDDIMSGANPGTVTTRSRVLGSAMKGLGVVVAVGLAIDATRSIADAAMVPSDWRGNLTSAQATLICRCECADFYRTRTTWIWEHVASALSGSEMIGPYTRLTGWLDYGSMTAKECRGLEGQTTATEWSPFVTTYTDTAVFCRFGGAQRGIPEVRDCDEGCANTGGEP